MAITEPFVEDDPKRFLKLIFVGPYISASSSSKNEDDITSFFKSVGGDRVNSIECRRCKRNREWNIKILNWIILNDVADGIGCEV